MNFAVETGLHQRLQIMTYSSFQFLKDSSNRKPANACNPYMIGHVANELRHHKCREDRMVCMVPGGPQVDSGGAVIVLLLVLPNNDDIQ